ncbi:DUF427 domain-containing protein [Streptomyces sp. NPDC048330]|uniref:DUF427 domain-containing protein n=1 Tax=Streptomyces sp. NPDC048330 TaxID=3365533 RepID=UPI0037152F9F
MDRSPTGPGEESVWDYPRPPRLEADRRHLSVRVGGTVVAETRAGLRILETSHPPVFYIPRRDVRTDLLRRASGASACEWKGTATYWDVVVGERTVLRAAWSYESPLAPYEALAGHLAFYPTRASCSVDGEAVAAQEGDFYGGWITSEVKGPFKGGPGTWGW